MNKNVLKICIFILTAFIGMSAFGCSVYAAKNQSCSGNCSAANKCKPARNGFSYVSTSSSNVINGKCIKDATANSCYNANPTSCSGSYNGLGSRGSSRNHYGSDIGSAACGAAKGRIQVYAPADGTIVWTGVSSGGGRTMVIEHEKKCSGGGKYKTIFRHLAAYSRRSGSVKKGETVGIEGGSNCYNKSAGDACICDNKEQSVGKVYSGCSKVHAYAIHLHMETVNSGFNGSNYSGGEADNVLETSCGAVQALCGGCPVDTSSCGGKMEMTSDGTVASMDGIEGGSEGGDFGGSGEYKSDKCDFKEYLDSQNCTFCEVFKKLWNAASIMAKTANDTLATPTKTLVSFGFVIWLCIYLLKQLTSYSKVSTAEMLKGILFQGFRVAVVLIALSGAIYELMDLTINPVLETGLSFGRTLNKDSTCDSSASYMQNIVGYDEKTGFPKPADGTGDEIGGLSKHLGESIICNLKTLEDKTGFLMSLGKYSMCLGWERHPILSSEFLPGLGYFSTGILLWITGLLLLLSFPWCLVDCILQLCISVALLPCAIGAYAFKITAQYLKMIWNMFMNAIFNFVFMALIIYIINAHLGNWIGYTPGTAPQDEVFITALQSYGLAWWGIGFFKIVIVCVFCWTFFDEASSMANEFGKGMSLHNIGRKLGGTVSQAALNYGVKPGAVVAGNLALGTGRRIGEAVNSHYGNSFRSGVNKLKGEVIKRIPARSRNTVTNPDGSTSTTATYSFLGFEQTRTVTKGADGIYTHSKETHRKNDQFGTRSTNDAFMQIKEKTDKNGKIVGRSIKFNNTTAKYLVNDDGTINMHAMQQMINGAENKERAYEGIMLMVAQKRGLSVSENFQSREVKINPDKSVTISQTNLDGTKQILTAQMIGNQMVLSQQSFDRKGNPIRFQKSNGVRTLTETYERRADGTYLASIRHGFTDYWQSKDILTEENGVGEWRFRYDSNMDAQKAMAGFGKNDFNEHMAQMQRARQTKHDRMPKNYISLDNLSADAVMARMGNKRMATPTPVTPQPAPTSPTPVTPQPNNPTELTTTAQTQAFNLFETAPEQPETKPEQDFIIDKNDKGEIITYSLEEAQKWEEAERQAQENQNRIQEEKDTRHRQNQEARKKREEQIREAAEDERKRVETNKENKKKLEEETTKRVEKREEYKAQLRDLQEKLRNAREIAQSSGKPEDIKFYNELKAKTEETRTKLTNILKEYEEQRNRYNRAVEEHNARVANKSETKEVDTGNKV